MELFVKSRKPRAGLWAIITVIGLIGAGIWGAATSEGLTAERFDQIINSAIDSRLACSRATVANKHTFAGAICEEALQWEKRADHVYKAYTDGRVSVVYEISLYNYETLQALESRG